MQRAEYKTVFYLALFILLTCALGLVSPYINLPFSFFLPFSYVATGGFLVAGLLVLSVFWEYPGRRALMGGLGMALLIVGIAGLASPTYYGLLSQYIRTIDLMVITETGIACLLFCLETTDETAPSMAFRARLYFLLAALQLQALGRGARKTFPKFQYNLPLDQSSGMGHLRLKH